MYQQGVVINREHQSMNLRRMQHDQEQALLKLDRESFELRDKQVKLDLDKFREL